MFPTYYNSMTKGLTKELKCRNPLKSGQCFLPDEVVIEGQPYHKDWSQSPQIGSMFPTEKAVEAKAKELGLQ